MKGEEEGGSENKRSTKRLKVQGGAVKAKSDDRTGSG